MAKILVLDCEIEKAILGKAETPIPGIQYAKNWTDYLGMGISCIGAWESWSDRYRVFGKPDVMNPVSTLTDSIKQADFIITFNGHGFDGPLLTAHGVFVLKEKHIDLLVEIRDKQGFDKYTKGFELDDVAKANGLPGKTGSGAHAPVLWQQGKYCEVIDYCLNDVWITKELLERSLRGHLVHPKTMKHCKINLPFDHITYPIRYPNENELYMQEQMKLLKEAYPEDYVEEKPQQTAFKPWGGEPTIPSETRLPGDTFIREGQPERKYLYKPDQALNNPDAMHIDPVISQVFADLQQRHQEGKMTDEDYRKLNAYFGNLMCPLPAHLRPENLN